ncbi:MAG: hypothetical protein WCH39_15370 [Schlesneria sp.]
MSKRSYRWIALEAVITLLATSGCNLVGRPYSSTRWTTNRPQFVQQQCLTVSSSPPPEQVSPNIWKMPDANDQQELSGHYVSGGSTDSRHWPAAIGSTGAFHMPNPWSTIRYGVMGMDNNGLGAGGVEAGVRIHAPTRITPYAGLSTDLGISNVHTEPYTYSNGRRSSRITKASGIAAIVPEAGVSCWVNSSTRVNAGASYFVAVDQPDFLVFGLSVEFLSPQSKGSTSPFDIPQNVGEEGNYGANNQNSAPYLVESVSQIHLVNSIPLNLPGPANPEIISQ